MDPLIERATAGPALGLCCERKTSAPFSVRLILTAKCEIDGAVPLLHVVIFHRQGLKLCLEPEAACLAVESSNQGVGNWHPGDKVCVCVCV